jgi:hypothetical protein
MPGFSANRLQKHCTKTKIQLALDLSFVLSLPYTLTGQPGSYSIFHVHLRASPLQRPGRLAQPRSAIVVAEPATREATTGGVQLVGKYGVQVSQCWVRRDYGVSSNFRTVKRHEFEMLRSNL